ncbi:MAG: hypothetical protein ACKPEA_14275 [Planctomycetota bacterium]
MNGARCLPLLLALAGLAAAAGCTTPPGIRVTGVDVVEVGADTSEVAVRLEIQNTTAEPIRLDTWDYSLDVRGQRAYSGVWVAAITVPAESRILTAIPATVSNAQLQNADAPWNASGWIRYLEPTRFSQMLYDLGLNRPSTTFGGSGPSMGKGGSVPSA